MIEWLYFTMGALLGFALGVYSSYVKDKETKTNAEIQG